MLNRLLGPARALLVGSLLIGSLACSGSDGEGSDDSDVGRADGGSTSTGGLETGEGPCESGAECAGEVCVGLIDGNNPPVYCTERCDGGCPNGFFCDSDTFALAELSFCRFGETTPGEPAPPPEEPPSLPCTDDASCDPGLVCATYEGDRECTIPCSAESDCTVSLGGVTLDLSNCEPDPTPGESRDVCLPDPACFPNVNSCIELPF